jgi:uncharacterized protein
MAEPIIFHPRKACAICKKPSHPKFHPFCSNRCTQIDLNRWWGGNYSIPGTEAEDQDENPE